MKRELFTTTLMILTISSCSSSAYRRTESIASKMERYSPAVDTSEDRILLKDNIPTLHANRSRMPASVIKKEVKSDNLSFYFSTLVSQYQQIYSFIPKKASLPMEHCPAFHNQFLAFKENFYLVNKKRSVTTNYSEIISEKNDKEHVELFLPMALRESHPSFKEQIVNNWNPSSQEQNSYLQKALSNYLAMMGEELNYLCDKGQSNNYYLFENMVQTTSSGEKVSLKSLFKNNLFYNLALISSLKNKSVFVPSSSRTPASVEISERDSEWELLERLNATEFYQSIKQLGK